MSDYAELLEDAHRQGRHPRTSVRSISPFEAEGKRLKVPPLRDQIYPSSTLQPKKRPTPAEGEYSDILKGKTLMDFPHKS